MSGGRGWRGGGEEDGWRRWRGGWNLDVESDIGFGWFAIVGASTSETHPVTVSYRRILELWVFGPRRRGCSPSYAPSHPSQPTVRSLPCALLLRFRRSRRLLVRSVDGVVANHTPGIAIDSARHAASACKVLREPPPSDPRRQHPTDRASRSIDRPCNRPFRCEDSVDYRSAASGADKLSATSTQR